MKRLLGSLAVVALVLSLLCIWVTVPHGTKAQSLFRSRDTHVAGVYDSTNYVFWGGEILSGNTATGSQTITVGTQNILPDGRFFQPLLPANGVFAAITIDMPGGGLGNGGPAETVTPTAVSQVTCPASAPTNQFCYNVTASFTYTHGASLNLSQIQTGDQGIMEAINDASNNGGGMVYWQADTGNVTLNTGGVTTTTTTKVPQAFLNMGGSEYINTTITVATSTALGVSGATSAFTTTCTSLTAGLNCSQFVTAPAKVAGGTGLTALLITAAGGTPGAGVVHARAWGYTQASASF